MAKYSGYVLTASDLEVLKKEVSDYDGTLSCLYDLDIDIEELSEENPIKINAMWNGHDEDLLWTSLKHPSVLFTLEVYGNNKNDIYKKYYKDGKMQVTKAAITFEPFNEAELKRKG